MISLFLNILLIFTFLFSGLFVQAFKKFISIITTYSLKVLSFFGIRFKNKEQDVWISEEFKNTYKEIKTVKLSKKNIKQESSIDWVALGIFLVAGILYLLNLKSLTGNMVSNWLFSLVESWGFVKTAIDMNIYFTAAIFSLLTFSLGKLWGRWKSTKQQRIEHKQAIIKAKAIGLMNSKELLDAAKKKDIDKTNELSSKEN